MFSGYMIMFDGYIDYIYYFFKQININMPFCEQNKIQPQFTVFYDGNKEISISITLL